MKNIFKWVYLIGLLVAVIAALLKFSAGWFTTILILVAILVGIFFFDSEDVMNLGIRYLALTVTAVSLDKFLAIGPYLTAIFTGVVGFLGPVVLTVLVMHFVKKYFLGKQ